MATRPNLRVSDADREATAAALREHYALGRLSLEEFNYRLSTAFAAVTQRDLDAVTSDLPHVRTPVAPLPVGGLAAGSQGGSGNADGGRAGSGRRAFATMLGLVASLAILLAALAPALWGASIFGAGRWGILAAGLLIIRAILRRIFGLGRFGGCSRGGHYTGYGRNGRSW